MKLDVQAAGSKRFALFRVYKISRTEELDMTKAKLAPNVSGFVPTRIYYGWALYVLIEADSSSFSAEASGRIFSVDAKVKAQASAWGAKTHVALRGLDTKIPNEVVIPRDENDIVSKFQVSDTPPQPILVDYTFVGGGGDDRIEWKNFVEPGFEQFDGQWARFRLYRDPRVAPGSLRVRLTNKHPRDWAVFEIFKRGEGNNWKRWELNAPGSFETTLPAPTWPMNLVWVGHKTREWNPNLDGETGWTLDFERIK